MYKILISYVSISCIKFYKLYLLIVYNTRVILNVKKGSKKIFHSIVTLKKIEYI